MRLQAKLALVLSPLVMGPALALGWISYDSLRGDLRASAEQGMESVLDLAAYKLEDLIDAARANTELLATAAPLERYARTDDAHERAYLLRAGLLALFYRYRDVYPEYEELRLLQPDGREDVRVAAGPSPAVEPNPGPGPDFPAIAAEARPLSLRLRAGGAEGDSALLLYRRIALRDDFMTGPAGADRTRAYLAVRVSLAPVFERLSALPFDFPGHLILALPDGRVLYDSSGQWTDGDLPPALTARLGQSPATLNGRATWDGSPCIVKVRRLEPGLYAMAALPADALAEPLTRLGATSLGLTGLGILLLTAVLMGGLRRLVVRPLEILRRAAGRIGAGELRPEIPIRSRDELGTLAEAVRGMGDNLARYRAEIEHLAFHDHLTGLPNRRLMRELLDERIAEAGREGRALAVLYIDLDNFKQINDALGHTRGDELLQGLALRLGALLAGPDGEGAAHLGRLGGDELLVVADRVGGPDGAADLAQRILLSTAEPFALAGSQYVITASIGITLHPRDADDADGLIRCADLAMYGAKAAGRNTLHFFSPELNVRAAARLRLENELRLAIGRGELALHYQPIVELASGRLVGLEALLRWYNADLGQVPPDRFIPVAEETGMIREIGRWALAQACRQQADWRRAGLATVPVSVNVSAAQLARECLAAPLAALLSEHGLTASDLHIEVTESVLMEQTLQDTGRLRTLRDLGLAIHIDDFGTGYSSLSYLQRLAVDCIKIDRSFIAQLCLQESDRSLVSAMIGLGRSLGLRVIAEGIEDAAQLEALRALGCAQGQGYWFARPMEASAAALLLSAGAVHSTRRRYAEAASVP